MTVIATLITGQYTAHATDSFITQPSANGTYTVTEDKLTKLVRVPAWHGAMSYWGLASIGTAWNTLQWLTGQAGRAHTYSSAGDFAFNLASNLTSDLRRFSFSNPISKGMGIHFTAYERIEDYWIPELFLISNWMNTLYMSVKPDGFSVTRETYASLKGIADRPAEHRNNVYRLEVRKYLSEGVILYYNNGDPALFNPIGNSIFATFQQLSSRRQIRDAGSAETHLSLVRRPVEVVSKLLTDLVVPGYRFIGGKPHDLAISPSGAYFSTTGD